MRNKVNRNDQLAAVYSRLLTERERLRSDRRSALEVLVAPDHTNDEDRIPILHEQFVVLSTHRTHRERLTAINEAIERYQSGNFGICNECCEPIPVKRLQAIPWAAHCVTCQERLDGEATEAEPELSLTA